MEEIEVVVGVGKNFCDCVICYGFLIIKVEFEFGGKFYFCVIG